MDASEQLLGWLWLSRCRRRQQTPAPEVGLEAVDAAGMGGLAGDRLEKKRSRPSQLLPKKAKISGEHRDGALP